MTRLLLLFFALEPGGTTPAGLAPYLPRWPGWAWLVAVVASGALWAIRREILSEFEVAARRKSRDA